VREAIEKSKKGAPDVSYRKPIKYPFYVLMDYTLRKKWRQIAPPLWRKNS
jgi:hypothetical protein